MSNQRNATNKYSPYARAQNPLQRRIRNVPANYTAVHRLAGQDGYPLCHRPTIQDLIDPSHIPTCAIRTLHVRHSPGATILYNHLVNDTTSNVLRFVHNGVQQNDEAREAELTFLRTIVWSWVPSAFGGLRYVEETKPTDSFFYCPLCHDTFRAEISNPLQGGSLCGPTAAFLDFNMENQGIFTTSELQQHRHGGRSNRPGDRRGRGKNRNFRQNQRNRRNWTKNHGTLEEFKNHTTAMNDPGHGLLHWLTLTAAQAWVTPALLDTAQNQFDALADMPELRNNPPEGTNQTPNTEEQENN